MHLHTLSLENFRNVEKITLEFSSGLNIFVGQNGQGKTNTLEAIYALSLSRPFRSREKEVFLRYGKEYGRIKGEVKLGKKEQENLEIFWENLDQRRNGTVFKKNGVEKISLEYLESKHFFAVLFAPEDMELPFAAPKKRRQYLSRVLSPIFPRYLEALINYEKVLKHRNKLLMKYHASKTERLEFAFWDAELVKWGEVLRVQRSELMAFIQNKIAEKYQLLSSSQDILSGRFLPSLEANADFFTELQASFTQDIAYGATQKGPHRDDFELLLNDKPLTETASRGEIRTALIALKLCERDFIAEQMTIFPVLLLDDVFSELDEERRVALLKIFADDQVFITTTHLPKLPKGKKVEIFTVVEGKFQKN